MLRIIGFIFISTIILVVTAKPVTGAALIHFNHESVNASDSNEIAENITVEDITLEYITAEDITISNTVVLTTAVPTLVLDFEVDLVKSAELTERVDIIMPSTSVEQESKIGGSMGIIIVGLNCLFLFWLGRRACNKNKDSGVFQTS